MVDPTHDYGTTALEIVLPALQKEQCKENQQKDSYCYIDLFEEDEAEESAELEDEKKKKDTSSW